MDETQENLTDTNLLGFKSVVFHSHSGTHDDGPKINPNNIVGVLKNAVVYNPPSLADGEGVTTTVTINLAALGDFAFASFSLNLQGITVTAYVSAADTVSVRFQNESGGVIDLASGTLSVFIIKNF